MEREVPTVRALSQNEKQKYLRLILCFQYLGVWMQICEEVVKALNNSITAAKALSPNEK